MLLLRSSTPSNEAEMSLTAESATTYVVVLSWFGLR
jgi:hypothetical protein